MLLFYSLMGWMLAPSLDANPERAHQNFLPETPPAPSRDAGYLAGGLWLRFDTYFYIDIAEQGYKRPAAVVFFPLYPLLIRALTYLGMPPLAAALLISRLAAFLLLWGMQRLLLLDLPKSTVRIAAVLLLLWPGSFILFAAYPDSMVMAATIWALVFARSERWWGATACAAIAATTKAVGVFVVLPLVIIAWRQHAKPWLQMLVVLATAGIYPLYLGAIGQITPDLAYRTYWATTVSLPWQTVWSALNAISAGNFIAALNLTFLIAVTLLALWQPIRREYLVYSIALILLFLTKKTEPILQSTLRYLLAVFPAMAALAAIHGHFVDARSEVTA